MLSMLILIFDLVNRLYYSAQQTGFLFNFAQRRLLDRLSRLHFSFGKRNLSIAVLNKLNLQLSLLIAAVYDAAC
ncbi:hypothetical protein D3C78_1845770 [compost metagenome]